MLTKATSRATRGESAVGQARRSTAPPGTAAVGENDAKSLSQKRSVVPAALAGSRSENVPSFAGQRAASGRMTPFEPATPTSRPR